MQTVLLMPSLEMALCHDGLLCTSSGGTGRECGVVVSESGSSELRANLKRTLPLV